MVCGIYYLLVTVHLMMQYVQSADLLDSEALGSKESPTKDIKKTDCSMRTGLT